MEQHTDKDFKKTFTGRIFRKIIDSGIPVRKVLNVVLVVYICGIILAVIWYNYVATVELNKLQWTCFMVIGLVVIVLFYRKDVRCTATVAIPILCSAKGRTVIIGFAFFLAATGPTPNIFYNINVMVSSLTCSQMQLKQAVSDMLDTLKKPVVTIKEAIGNVIKELRKVVLKVKAVLLRIEELVITILAGIKNGFSWLENIVEMCNTEFGTPYERCMNISNISMQNCIEVMGPIKGLCRLTHVFSMLCHTAKIVDAICVLVDFVDDSIIQTVKRKLDEFVIEIKKIFDVSITFEHDFYFQTTSSKELEQIKLDIMADVQKRIKIFKIIFNWLDLMTIALFVLIIFKNHIIAGISVCFLSRAIYFRLKYISNPAYKNDYITNEFVEIDERRRAMKMETVLPLKLLESLRYIGLTDCRLTKREWMGIARSSVFLVISSIQLFCICFADYCLHWILDMISFYGYNELEQEVPAYITVDVDGGGFVGDIFRGIVLAFEPATQNFTIDLKTCLPKPKAPNYLNYYIITIITLMAWIFLFCQPYGLRLRHVIMRLYYPEVAQKRAAWLYNKILLSRISFFKLARRKARLLYINNTTEDYVSLLDWLRNRTGQYWIFPVILGRTSKDKCILCGIPLNKNECVRCETVGCVALYCKNCFEESFELCCLCNKPVDYGDFSDLSEVEDSSDDPDAVHVDETEKYCV